MNKETFTNPILPGFYPDPSICRVGEDYYMITSSFAFFPGVPIFNSKNLVDWEQIGHILDRPSQLKLDGAAYSGGIFAPTIRYHKGTFYVITTNTTAGGNFIVTSENPAGPWSDPYWLKDAPGIDPSLFFDDDDKVYCMATRTPKEAKHFGDNEIWLQELDLETMTLVGEKASLWNGSLKNAFFPEGPHIYKINDFYYLMISEGGTEHYHAVSIARSKNIWGPYEDYKGNPILTHRHLGKKHPITNPGHADFVETQNGQWYMVALASRPYGGYYKNLGRETFLMPMEWEDGWPIVSPETGKVEFTYPVPNLPSFSVEKKDSRDDFDNDTLDYIWNSIRTLREEFYSLTERPGYLRLKVRPQGLLDTIKLPSFDESIRLNNLEKEEVIDNPSFIGRRQQHINFEVCTKMEFKHKSDSEIAGVALVQDNNHQFRFEYAIEEGKKVIRLIKNFAKVEFNFAAKTCNYENIESTLAKKEFQAEVIYLKVTARGQDYSFYFGSSVDNMEVLIENVDGRILSTDVAGGFVGAYIGMFATSNGEESDNVVDFDWFVYKEIQ